MLSVALRSLARGFFAAGRSMEGRKLVGAHWRCHCADCYLRCLPCPPGQSVSLGVAAIFVPRQSGEGETPIASAPSVDEGIPGKRRAPRRVHESGGLHRHEYPEGPCPSRSGCPDHRIKAASDSRRQWEDLLPAVQVSGTDGKCSSHFLASTQITVPDWLPPRKP